MTDTTINFDEDGILTVKIPLKGGVPLDREVSAYGTLRKAEAMVFQYFVMEDMRKAKEKEKAGLVLPA